MVLDLEVQEVLGDGSVVFSEGPVPGLILRASKYHRAGECFGLAHCGWWGNPCPSLLPSLDTEFPNTWGRGADSVETFGMPVLHEC